MGGAQSVQRYTTGSGQSDGIEMFKTRRQLALGVGISSVVIVVVRGNGSSGAVCHSSSSGRKAPAARSTCDTSLFPTSISLSLLTPDARPRLPSSSIPSTLVGHVLTHLHRRREGSLESAVLWLSPLDHQSGYVRLVSRVNDTYLVGLPSCDLDYKQQ
jgi:hypothetical protein